MTSVRHAVLGLLLQEPAYPYQLCRTFEDRLGPAWQINRGQIYQTVYRLEEDGSIERLEERRTARGPSRVFGTTDKGEEEFDRWFLRRSEGVRPLRDELRVKLALARPKDVDHLLQAIERQQRYYVDRVTAYSEAETALAQPGGELSWDGLRNDLLVGGAVTHLDAEIAWLRDAREKLHNFKALQERRPGLPSVRPR